MGAQRTFASVAWQQKGKITRRERFLAEMNAVVPWAALEARIRPHYPKAGRGRQPHPLPTMLRLYCVQQWFNLSDPAAEDALYDSEAIRRFVGVELADDRVPDESTILRFRHLLERHHLTAQLFGAIQNLLEEKRLVMKAGTIVDATIIAAPSSTKNATKTRDPEMRQTRKGKQWHFGMKLHIGTDLQGLVHTLTATDAAAADITQLPYLLHGQERTLYGDQAYWCEDHRAQWTACGDRYAVNQRGTHTRPLTAHQRAVNRSRSKRRALGEHPFHVVKHLWGFTKVRYRGVMKNLTRAYAMFGLANLYRVRARLLPPGFVPCLT
jgi:IS5 family transposase